MNKLTLPVILLVILLSSCERALDLLQHVPVPGGVDTSGYFSKDTSCQLIAQSSSYIDQEPRSQMFGFNKIINTSTGRVDSLITAIGGKFEVDSFFYWFEYLDANIVHIDGVIKTYNRLNSAQEWELDNASIINNDLQLDSNGLTSLVMAGPAVLQKFNYENGKLVSVDIPSDPPPFSKFTFEYDEEGNLVTLKRGDEKNSFTVNCTYDYTRTAKTQIYTPTSPFHLYEIMGWIPVAPKNLRTKHTATNRTTGEDQITKDEVLTNITYSNHHLNPFGVLESFDAHIDFIDLNTAITNTTSCSVARNPHLPF